MILKAIVYDTQNREPMETTVRCIFCDESGKPNRIQAHNGLNYNQFHIWDDTEPSKWNGYKSNEDLS